ncbi:MAG: LysM peptidoglycan-binding domain-containing protein [Methyloprofundus sp.]|nr:LysM peptidoglycan-binding domain-containing protein [Methyloprofundus sp.]
MIKPNRCLIISSMVILLLMQGCSLQQPIKTPVTEQPVSIVDPANPTEQGTIENAISIVEKGEIIVPEINDSWQYIISLYAIPDVDNARIDRAIKRFLAHPEYIQKIQTRAEPYLYNIIQEIEAKGLPGELALLPAIESGFKAHAYSHARAAGLWQFIPATGKIYGLDQNWWYDGRRDVYSSTAAATSYLKKLGAMFGHDWLLALASYNAGMGTVGKAIKRNRARNKPTDFWSLKLPRETQNYVPKLLALAKIFANPGYYGITLKTQEHKPTFVAVNIGSQLDLSKAAQLGEISLDELFHLNPGFNRGYTPPQGPHRLLIPVENAEIFKKNLAMLPDDQRVQWHRHKIKAGENLGSIARRYQTRIKVIREVNRLKNNNIRAGAYLMVPAAQNTASHNPFIRANAINPRKKYPSYKVRKGDSLWSIAKKFKTRSKDIARWNRIGLKSALHPGQTLIIKKRS